MITQTSWVERTFEFNFPAGLFPCILQRVKGTPARLEEMIASFPPNILTMRLNNRWSIQEHVGHLTDLDELHDGRIDDYLAGKEMLRPADMTNTKTKEANHNAKEMKTILSKFRSRRITFVQRLEALDEKALLFTAVHPRLKQRMRLVDMVFFTAEHDVHHIASIDSLEYPLLKQSKDS